MSFLSLLDRFANLLFLVVRWFCIVVATALFLIVVLAIIARYGFGQVFIVSSTAAISTP